MVFPNSFKGYNNNIEIISMQKPYLFSSAVALLRVAVGLLLLLCWVLVLVELLVLLIFLVL